MTRTEHAVDLFRRQFNCSQAVFAAFRQPEALDEQTALRLATVFGAGLACTGRGMCGAISGALLALSMKHGRGDVQDVEARNRTYQLSRQLMADFAAQNGSCACNELLGVDIGTPEGMKQAQAERLFETRCLGFVRSAAALVDPLL